MSEISFQSTFRIPITQPGVNKAKKKELKALVEMYQNHLLPSGRQGFARVSMPNSEDANFIQKIKTIGYKVFQIFDGENVSKEGLDDFIKERLDVREFSQLGKNKKAISQSSKNKNEFVAQALKEEQKKEAKLIEERIAKETEKEVKQEEPKIVKQNIKKEYKPKLTPFTKPLTRDQIRKKDSYIEMCEQYGKDFTEAVFFHDKQFRR